MNLKHLLRTVLLITTMSACLTPKPINETPATKTGAKQGPLNPQNEQIEMNSIISEGIIKTKDGNSFFVVSKVYSRGRSAPHVMTKQVLELKSIHPALTPLNTTVKGILRCESPNNEANCKWEFKLIQ